MNTPIVINILIFLGLLFLLFKLSRPSWSLARKVFLGLLIGVIFGLALQFVYQDPQGHAIVQESVKWFNIVGNGYVRMLQMIVMPLVLVSILSAVAKLHNASSLGKISGLTISTLLFTTMIAAVVGVLVANLFHLSAVGMTSSDRELKALDNINSNLLGRVADLTVPDILIGFIPKNPFNALADLSSTAIISVVIFAVMLGMASIQLTKNMPEKGLKVLGAIETLQTLVMTLVRLIMKLTPYGVMALMTKVVANSNLADILNLGNFILASYLGIGIMFVVHGVLLGITGINPLRFFKKIWPVLTFAFTSRSSAATIPINVEAQVRRIGVPESIASFSASFGATIGQNGCAGLYPAMLAIMVAPTVGINPFDPIWLATLVGIITISSIGVAGVGGGAIFAALIVLPTMGLPVELVALLISIEPIIDMGRTALNVSGAMVAGTVTSQLLKETNKDIFCAEDCELTKCQPNDQPNVKV